MEVRTRKMSKLTKKLDVRITEDEYREVHKQRDCFRFTTLSDLMRGHIETGICYRIDFDKLSEVAKEISIIGDKINQIAATVNSTLQIKTINKG